MIWAAILLFAGVVLSLLMVTEVLEPSLFLNMVAAGSSTVGLMTGFMVVTQIMRPRK